MKAWTLASLLGMVLATVFVRTPPVFAYHPSYGDRYSDYNYGDAWDYGEEGDQDYSYGGYRDYGYGRPPYCGGGYRYDDYDDYDDYEHPSGLLGHWGQVADHHRRGHRHQH
jgi:hypothetical protein